MSDNKDDKPGMIYSFLERIFGEDVAEIVWIGLICVLALFAMKFIFFVGNIQF